MGAARGLLDDGVLPKMTSTLPAGSAITGGQQARRSFELSDSASLDCTAMWITQQIFACCLWP
jgi:hypothetical protein